MEGPAKDYFLSLCIQASVERDPDKLRVLAARIQTILEASWRSAAAETVELGAGSSQTDCGDSS
jgi:hypothetical protein